MSESLKIYFIVVLILGPVVLFIVNRIVRRLGRKRRSSLKTKRFFSPIITRSPVSDPNDEFKESGLENINLRFTIIKRTFATLWIFIWVLMLVIPLLGKVPATVLSIFAASLGVLLGIISRPFLENFISGIIITFNKPFQVGDTVSINERYGTIEDITMTTTILKQWDWRRYVIPNSKMLNTEFINHTKGDNFIWAKVAFWVAYDADVTNVKQIAKQVARDSPYYYPSEEPSFWLMEMGSYGYKCWVAAWASSPSKAWELTSNVRKNLIIEFQKAGIKTHLFHNKDMPPPVPGG